MPSEFKPPEYKLPRIKPPKKCLRTFISPGLIFGILRYLNLKYVWMCFINKHVLRCMLGWGWQTNFIFLKKSQVFQLRGPHATLKNIFVVLYEITRCPRVFCDQVQMPLNRHLSNRFLDHLGYFMDTLGATGGFFIDDQNNDFINLS